MGARKGQNNFGSHQRQVVEDNLRKVQIALKALPRRTKYQDVHAVVRAVAVLANLDPTTLSRNARYRTEVLRFIAEKPSLLLSPPDEVISLASSKAKEIETDIEVGQLKRENARLRKLIERPGAIPELPTPREDRDGDAERHRRAFEQTATVLGRLLAHLASEEIGIVLDDGVILNTVQVGPQRFIAGPPDTNAYVEWWRRQPQTRNQDTGER